MVSTTEQAGTTSGTETDPELSRKGSPPGASGRAVGIQFGSDSIPFRVPLGAFSGVPFLILFGFPGILNGSASSLEAHPCWVLKQIRCGIWIVMDLFRTHSGVDPEGDR